MKHSQLVDTVEDILLDAILDYECLSGSSPTAATFTYPGNGLSRLDSIMADALRTFEGAAGIKLTRVAFTYERPEFGVPVYSCEAR